MAKKIEKKEKEVKTKKPANVKKLKKEKKAKESFAKGIKKEMKLVKWPTSKELIKYTIATIVFCIILIIFFQFLDVILAFIKGMFA